MGKYKERILELRARGLSYNAIVEKLGCSKSSVSYHCSKLDNNEEQTRRCRESLRRSVPPPSEKGALLDWLLIDGVRRKDIADALDMEYEHVLAYARRNKMRLKHDVSLNNYERVKRRRRHLKMLAVAIKGGRCERCGYNRSIHALTFHHKDPANKDFTLSNNANRSWSKNKKELEGCAMLCLNCHQEVHDELKIGDSPRRHVPWFEAPRIGTHA